MRNNLLSNGKLLSSDGNLNLNLSKILFNVISVTR